MTDTKKGTIQFTPYRGHLEPVGEVRKAEITLLPNHIEIINSYDFTPYLPEPDDVPYRKYATLLPKSLVAIELTEQWHDKDVDKLASPCVEIFLSGRHADTIYVETEREAYIIYNRIKNWLINE